MREIIEAVRLALPDASSQAPGTVLNHVGAAYFGCAGLFKNGLSSDSSICSSKKLDDIKSAPSRLEVTFVGQPGVSMWGC
jgi:hypothetical protein